MKEKIQIKKCSTFVILNLIMFLIIMTTCSGTIYSQIISNANIESGDYEINTNGATLNNYTQKILQYKDKLHIILTTLTVDNQARFYLIEQGQTNSKFADIPIQYKVKDFSILGDTLYFCGNMETVDTAFHESTQGFIAYVNIDDLFFIEGSKCNYSRIPTTTIVKKIKTYHNDNGERVVVGIGEQFYSYPPHQRESTVDPHPHFKVSFDDWVYPDTNHYNCFIGYKIIEKVTDPAFPSINPFYLYRHQTSQDDTSYQYLYKYEEFKDLAITDNYICLASTYYFNPTVTGSISHNENIVLRRVDKNNFDNHVSNFINLSSSDIGHADYGFSLEALDKDNVAITHVACAYPLSNDTRTIVTKVNLSNEPFEFIHSSLVDTDPGRILMQDIEYLPEIDHLLVLKEKYNANYLFNIAYYVDMYENIFGNSTSGFYNTKFLSIPQSIFPVQTWSNLLKFNKSNFAIVGNTGNKLGLIDNEAKNFNTNNCRTINNKTINQREINIFTQFDNLWPCTFALLYPYAPGFYYPGNTTIIYTMNLQQPNIGNININCEKK